MSKINFNLLPKPPDGNTGWPWDVPVAPIPDKMPDGRLWPRISVTVPSFNQGEYLEATLRSLIFQGYPDLEIFVMDGGSNDQSLEILQKYSSFITAWESKPDRGQSHAINKGWNRSSGELIAYLNSDDIYLVDALEQVALAWNHDYELAVICGGVDYIGSNGGFHKTMLPKLFSPSPLDLSLIDIGEWYLPQQACFFSRKHLDRVGRSLREDLHYVMDRELMYRVCREGKVVLLTKILAADRQHPSAKRQKDRLKLYREDAIAMKYCNWGTNADIKRRGRVAHQRMGQGYWLAARDEEKPLKKLDLYSKSIVYRPTYIKSLPGIKNILLIIRLFRRQYLGFLKRDSK